MRASALCMAGVLMLLAGCGSSSGTATIEDAWIPAAPPGAGVMAGYLLLRNGSSQALRCDRASGADFGAAEIHRSVIESGQSRMLRDQVIEVAAGESAQLAPGGLHLMLFRPARAFEVGDQTVLNLHCGGVTVTASARIQDPR